MLHAAPTPRHSACLQRLAEWTEAVLALSVRRIEAAQDSAARLPSVRPERAESPDRPDNDHRPVRREFERESETESDGHADTPLGRTEALEALLTRGSHLDPDGRITAEVIQIKAFLTEGAPEPPGRGPPPPQPSGSRTPSAADPPLGRPLNRAERRRLRRSSG